jgi:hypothetical protein
VSAPGADRRRRRPASPGHRRVRVGRQPLVPPFTACHPGAGIDFGTARGARKKSRAGSGGDLFRSADSLRRGPVNYARRWALCRSGGGEESALRRPVEVGVSCRSRVAPEAASGMISLPSPLPPPGSFLLDGTPFQARKTRTQNSEQCLGLTRAPRGPSPGARPFRPEGSKGQQGQHFRGTEPASVARRATPHPRR